MGQAEYRRALEAAIKEYERLQSERDAVETRLAQLRQIIAGLGPLCELPSRRTPPPELGLTDACRSALRASLAGLTAGDVRERIRGLGIDLDSYSNPLASIHIVLKRLVASGEAFTYRGRDGKPVYAWKRPAIPIAVTGHEHAHALVTGVSWPGLTEFLIAPERRKIKTKKET
ncbi:MAG TPA: hypothetical protein VHI98_25130 [Vicinamibacterales bacterium]|jgi:hypothetical protein|nr:hypothetical protein [Vicinamibacterales bacterium]